MTRATTPSHKFYVDVDPRLWDSFKVTYSQGGGIVVEKTEKDNVVMSETKDRHRPYTLSVTLTQEETRRFVSGVRCDVQIRCHYATGASFASKIIHLSVEDVLNSEVIE